MAQIRRWLDHHGPKLAVAAAFGAACLAGMAVAAIAMAAFSAR